MSRATSVFYDGREMKQAPCSIITGVEAANKVTAAPHDSYTGVGFNGVDADRLGLKLGAMVAITPVDSGKYFPRVKFEVVLR